MPFTPLIRPTPLDANLFSIPINPGLTHLVSQMQQIMLGIQEFETRTERPFVLASQLGTRQNDFVGTKNIMRRALAFAQPEDTSLDLRCTTNFWAKSFERGLLVTPDLPHRSPELLAKITRGDAFETALIVTHQAPDLQVATAHALESQPEWISAPRIGFSSSRYPMREPKLLQQLTLNLHSMDGGWNGFEILADTYIMMGGWVGQCLTRTTKDLLQILSHMGRSSCRIIFPLNLCCWWSNGGGWDQFREEEQLVTDLDQALSLAKQFCGNDYDYTFDSASSNPNHFVVLHERDGVQVQIEFVQKA